MLWPIAVLGGLLVKCVRDFNCWGLTKKDLLR